MRAPRVREERDATLHLAGTDTLAYPKPVSGQRSTQILNFPVDEIGLPRRRVDPAAGSRRALRGVRIRTTRA